MRTATVIAALTVLGGSLAFVQLRSSPKRVFLINGQKVSCHAEDHPCGLTLYSCSDAPKIRINCATDIPEMVEAETAVARGALE
jgi:hypothetical protein